MNMVQKFEDLECGQASRRVGEVKLNVQRFWSIYFKPILDTKK
jgi:hypothetical protein